MQVRLADPTFARDLVAFLRRCECSVVERGRGRLDVTLDKQVSHAAIAALVRAGHCYLCGTEIARGLLELGSTRCHDCRNGSGYASTSLPDRWARMELEAYLRTWDALHPDALAVVVD